MSKFTSHITVNHYFDHFHVVAALGCKLVTVFRPGSESDMKVFDLTSNM